MKYFSVTIIERGIKSKQTIKADSRLEAIELVRKEFPKSMVTKAVETAAPLEDIISGFFAGIKKSSKSKIPMVDKISTIRQIAVMTNAGIAINDTLEEIATNTENPQLKEIYFKLNADISAGNSMSVSMEPYREEFGHVALAMTDLGERTGNISEAYAKLATILEDIQDNNKKFKKAMRSPMITLSAMGIAFTILIMVVVPQFKSIFEKLGSDLPLPTVILLDLEYAFSNYGPFIIVIVFVLIRVMKYMYKHNKDFKFKMDQFMISPNAYMINKAIFLSTMHKYNLVFGELVRAGVPVAEALETAVGMVDNEAIKEKLLTVNGNIGRGMSLAESFEITGLYQNMLLQMIKAGESGGQLDAMLDKVTDYYYGEFQEFIENISAYIEPIMGFFIAGLVLLMALGIFMPMWDLGKAVK